jgi:DNA polymerase I-like protein with 3'-5' exonuclease and polymerase domains
MRTLPPLPDWCSLEHQVQEILTEQELYGWSFNESKAQQLESHLRGEMEEVTGILREQFPLIGGKMFTPKRDNATQGYRAGCELQRLVEFNPTSRDHIAWILQNRLNITLTQTTTTGKPIIDEIILKEMNNPFCTLCAKALDLKKKLGMISQGVNAWLKLCTTSKRIHHHCSVSTNTFRCAHRKPNLAQVPAEAEFRELFTASPGMVMVGADLSGIELRMLAHYLGRYDGGRYADILLNDDIHQVNADKIGITRRQVKTVTYAFLYGAGNEKIGTSYDNALQPKEARKKGSEIRKAFVSAIEGLSELLGAVAAKSANGFLLACDGRRVLVDSPHKGLNYLLQSSASIVAKRQMVIANDTLKQKNFHTHQLAFVHDELQYECEEKNIDEVKFTLELSAKLAGEFYGLRCPIAAESQSGRNWSEVH